MKLKFARLLSLMFLLFLTLSLCRSASADKIVLTNGDHLTGAIQTCDAKTLVIKTESAGNVSVKWADIKSITSDEPLHVGVRGGQMIVGTVATAPDSTIQITTQTAGVVSVAKDAIVVIRNDAEQAAYEAHIQRLEHPHLGDLWSGTFDTGLSLTRGNSSTLSYTLAAKAVRLSARDKISVYATAVYGRDDTTPPATTIAHQIQGGIRADVDFTERWFLFASTDFNSNQLQHLDLQNVIAGGIGYHVIQTQKATLDIFAGMGFNQEFFAAYTLTNPLPPPPLLPFTAVTQRNMELEFGEDVSTKVSSRTSVNETLMLYPNITGPSGYRLTFNSSVATSIHKWLGWQFSFADNFLSNPPVGIKGNDLILSTGLRLTFGKGPQ